MRQLLNDLVLIVSGGVLGIAIWLVVDQWPWKKYERKLREREKRYRDGFGYAMYEYYVNGRDAMMLEGETDSMDRNEFDHGMLLALDIIDRTNTQIRTRKNESGTVA